MAAHKGNTYTENRKINPQYTKKEIAEIVEKLLAWAKSEDDLYIASFAYDKYKRSDTWLYDLSTHHPEIKDALDIAKKLIAAKVTRHSWLGDRNSNFGEKILPMYCDDYKALLKWKADITKELADSDKSKSAVVEYLKQQSEKKSDPK